MNVSLFSMKSLTKESSLTVWGGIKGECHSAEAQMTIIIALALQKKQGPLPISQPVTFQGAALCLPPRL